MTSGDMRGDMSCVHSKDAQKQLVQTSPIEPFM